MKPEEKVSIRTSTTGKWSKQGFTLVELLLVITLIGIVLVLAVPSTRDVLTGDMLKKTSRQLIGLERKLRTEAVRDQLDYILHLDLSDSVYWITASDMTEIKQAEIKKQALHLPEDVRIIDVVDEDNRKITAGEVKIVFKKDNICSPRVIHLAYKEDKMTIVMNPFMGVTDIYDQYVEIPFNTSEGQNRR